MSFTELGLCEPILRAVAEKGYDQPSAIQLEAIPAVLKGLDVMADYIMPTIIDALLILSLMFESFLDS